MSSAQLDNLTDTWADSNIRFRGINLDVTNTASHAESLLQRLAIDGDEKFSVGIDGSLRIDGHSALITDGSTLTLGDAGHDQTTVHGRLVIESGVEIAGIPQGSDDADLAFRVTRDGSLRDALRITHDGNVHLGGVSPDELLHITGDSNGGEGEISSPPTILIEDQEIGAAWDIENIWGALAWCANDPSTAGAIVRAKVGPYHGVKTGGNSGLKFFTAPSSGLRESLRIMPNGHLYFPAMDTEELEIMDSGTEGATVAGWIEIEIGGDTQYVRTYRNK